MAIPSVQVPASRTFGNSATNPTLQNYIFQSGMEKPEVSSILTYIYPQYLLTALIDRIGLYEPVQNSVFSWAKLGRTRASGEVASISGGTGATATFTTTFPHAAATPGYVIPGDILRFESGALGRVSAVGESGGFQTVSVVRTVGGNWSTALINNGFKWGHASTAFGEGTDGPLGRSFTPDLDYNVTQIFKRTTKISRTSLQTKTWLEGNKAWFWTDEEVTFKEHLRDIEAAMLLGDLNQTRTGVQTTRGILDFIFDEGIVKDYNASLGVQESDLMNMIKDMLVEGTSNEVLVLCGADFLMDVQVALKPYVLNGGIQFGTLGNNVVGLDLHQYKVLGKRLTFAHYEMFNDDKILPYTDAPVTGKINFDKFGLFLDMGSENGRNILMKYMEKDGIQSKLIHSVVPGTVNPFGGASVSSNLFDGVQTQVLSEVGLEFKLPNRCGVLKAA